MHPKLLSGRFFLVVVVGIVFAYTSIAKILPVDKVSEIILLVMCFYFAKNNGGGTPGSTTKTETK